MPDVPTGNLERLKPRARPGQAGARACEQAPTSGRRERRKRSNKAFGKVEPLQRGVCHSGSGSDKWFDNGCHLKIEGIV